MTRAELLAKYAKDGKVMQSHIANAWDEALEAAAELGKHVGCEIDSDCRTCKYVDMIRELKGEK